MGCSGAGKTTLLNVLTNRSRHLIVDGEISVNGKNVGDSIGKLSAYIQQHDIFVGTLTVKEHLIFQALLRMDKNKSYEERIQRVNEVIDELALNKCADTVIGIIGKMTGISGGEAKRLAFASEIITNPSLLFCDEPTSGLDSFMSQNVISILRDMTRGGRTIICVIHQPSSEVYELFDHLLLMAEGKVAYRGMSTQVIEFFKRTGLYCPVNFNPADFFIHNLTVIPGKEEECRKQILKICDQFLKEQEDIQISTSIGYSFPEKQMKSKSGLANGYRVSWLKQFSAVLWRSWISAIREPMITKTRFLQSVFVSLVLGLVYLNQKMDEKGVMNINGAIFIIIIQLTFTNLISVINTFVSELPLFYREHSSGMYRTDVYFIGKSLAEIPILTLSTVVFVSIWYWMIGFNPDPIAFVIFLTVSILITNTAISFGYMISCYTSSFNVAQSLISPLMLPFLLFGGYYLHTASVPVYFIWLKYISWIYYSNEALTVNQWSSITNISCSTQHCTPNGTAVLKALDFHKENLLFDIIILAVLMLSMRLLAFLGLLIKSTK